MINLANDHYIRNLEEILTKGTKDENPRGRYESDGAPAHSYFITHSFETYDLSKGEFPITTMADTAHKMGRGEILWIYQDQSNDLSLLRDKYGVSWWDLWDVGDGTIGERYGATIKAYDQMNRLLQSLLADPFNRGNIMSMYQLEHLFRGPGLRPCAHTTDWSVRKSEEGDYYILDMLLFQRSNDYVTAGYINKSQYTALMLMVVGHLRYHGMNIQPGKFSHSVTNLHIYDRHLDIAVDILQNAHKNKLKYDSTPEMILLEEKDFYSYTVEDVLIQKYEFHKKVNKPELAI